MLTFSDGGRWRSKWLNLNCHHRKLVDLSCALQEFAERFYSNWRNESLLVVCGPSGTGKTRSAKGFFEWAKAVRLYISARGSWPSAELPRVEWIDWPAAVNHINDNRTDFLPDLYRSALLILDDVGAENDPWRKGADRLCQLLNARERSFTFITTNITPDKWAEKYDARIADRFMRNSVVVDLDGVPSWATHEPAPTPKQHAVAALRGSYEPEGVAGQARTLKDVLKGIQ